MRWLRVADVLVAVYCAGLLNGMANLAWSAALKGEADLTVSTLVIEKSKGTIGGRAFFRVAGNI